MKTRTYSACQTRGLRCARFLSQTIFQDYVLCRMEIPPKKVKSPLVFLIKTAFAAIRLVVLMNVSRSTESSPLVPKQDHSPTKENMGLKFTVVAGVFQVVLLILFGTITRYGELAMPPKNATIQAENDIKIYYPSEYTFFLSLCCFLLLSLFSK